jgi:hypothetical protein
MGTNRASLDDRGHIKASDVAQDVILVRGSLQSATLAQVNISKNIPAHQFTHCSLTDSWRTTTSMDHWVLSGRKKMKTATL